MKQRDRDTQRETKYRQRMKQRDRDIQTEKTYVENETQIDRYSQRERTKRERTKREREQRERENKERESENWGEKNSISGRLNSWIFYQAAAAAAAVAASVSVSISMQRKSFLRRHAVCQSFVRPRARKTIYPTYISIGIWLFNFTLTSYWVLRTEKAPSQQCDQIGQFLKLFWKQIFLQKQPKYLLIFWAF